MWFGIRESAESTSHVPILAILVAKADSNRQHISSVEACPESNNIAGVFIVDE
jgi:hypothetical protein